MELEEHVPEGTEKEEHVPEGTENPSSFDAKTTFAAWVKIEGEALLKILVVCLIVLVTLALIIVGFIVVCDVAHDVGSMLWGLLHG